MFVSTSTPWLAIFPTIALVLIGALVALAFRLAPTRPRRTWARVIPHALATALFALLCSTGLVDATPASILALSLAVVISASCSFFSADLKALLKEVPSALSGRFHLLKAHPGVIFVVWVTLGLVAASLFATLALEYPFSDARYPIYLDFAATEVALIAGLLLTAWLAGGRHSAGVHVVIWVLAGFGLANYYLFQFKRAVVLPTDIFALKTAANVAGGYSYQLHDQALFGLAAAFLASSFVSLMASVPLKRKTKPVAWGVAAVASVALSAGVILLPDYRAAGAGINYFFPPYTYRIHGSLLSFIAGCQDLKLKAPKGYSDDQAQALLAQSAKTYDTTLEQAPERQAAVAQFDQTKPNVLVIMDETFADLSIYDELHAGYTGPVFLKTGLTDAVSKGSLAVSVFGGNTCNTEFEFLTQNSFAYLGQGKYPYSMYDLTNVESLPKYFRQLGYTASAIHPNIATNWDRDRAYPALGFEHFYDISSFSGAPRFHSGVSDAATFDFAYDLIAQASTPQFVFAVTMQNHSGYNQNNIPTGQLTHFAPDAGTAQDTAQLNEYLSCITESDRALEALIDKLKALDKPTIVLFFGDHQPSLAQTYADAWFSSEDSLAYTQLQYQTVYALWANYQLGDSGLSPDSATSTNAPTATNASAATNASSAEKNSSPTYLASQLLYRAGFPLTDYQKAQLVTQQVLPSLNAFGAQDANGTWHELDALPDASVQAFTNMATITYWEFARQLQK